MNFFAVITSNPAVAALCLWSDNSTTCVTASKAMAAPSSKIAAALTAPTIGMEALGEMIPNPTYVLRTRSQRGR